MVPLAPPLLSSDDTTPATRFPKHFMHAMAGSAADFWLFKYSQQWMSQHFGLSFQTGSYVVMICVHSVMRGYEPSM